MESKIGKKYGKLLVIDRDKETKKYICICDCGKETLVSSSHLACSHTKSCGCLKFERKNNKYNYYDIYDDFAIFYTSKSEPFWVDKEDVEKIKDYCWYKDKKGYIVCHMKNKNPFLHRFIMDAKDDEIIDHINNEKSDNRKKNLRIVSASVNQHNRKNKNRNSSGVVGVYQTSKNVFSSTIMIDNVSINLGTYNNFYDAVVARLKSEKENFGMNSTQSDLFEEYGV